MFGNSIRKVLLGFTLKTSTNPAKRTFVVSKIQIFLEKYIYIELFVGRASR